MPPLTTGGRAPVEKRGFLLHFLFVDTESARSFHEELCARDV